LTSVTFIDRRTATLSNARTQPSPQPPLKLWLSKKATAGKASNPRTFVPEINNQTIITIFNPSIIDMRQPIENKVYTMFWDLPPAARQEAVEKFVRDPLNAFNDEQILLKALNTLNWYELISLTGGPACLIRFLDDRTIGRLFPKSRKIYYKNAKRLLSKYIISPSE
jgi:hypothetical protein